MSCYDQMSEILREGHALSTDPTFPRAYEASILNPLHYKFLATPLYCAGYWSVDARMRSHLVRYSRVLQSHPQRYF